MQNAAILEGERENYFNKAAIEPAVPGKDAGGGEFAVLKIKKMDRIKYKPVGNEEIGKSK